MTDYHDLTTPEEGADDWHLPLNENFRTIDEKIEIRDEASAKSDYPPKAGAKYLATDTGEQWIGDGDEWNRLASTGESPEFSSVSHRKSSGRILQRSCLFSGAPDGESISIPAGEDYDIYYTRLLFLRERLRISFNTPPGETSAHRNLINNDELESDDGPRTRASIGVLNVYIDEGDDRNDINEIASLGPFVSDTYTLSDDPINQIFFDNPRSGQVANYVEAWGIKNE
jgi:hypothetical protein